MKDTTKKNKRKKENTALLRYSLISIVLLLFVAYIIGYTAHLMITQGDYLRAISKAESVGEKSIVFPRRGDILSADGQPLAISQALYGIYMDFHADGLVGDTLYKHLSEISVALEREFPTRTAAEYRKLLRTNWELSRKEKEREARAKRNNSRERVKKRTRYVRLIKEDVNYIQRKYILSIPFFNRARSACGLVIEERRQRLKPFGSLANRTIGNIYKDISKGGSGGLELKYDSLLRGTPGFTLKQKVGRSWRPIQKEAPEDGYNIHTTLDMEIQDITEKALKTKLEELEAESGCAIVVETSTGRIRAISNLDRTSQGTYIEGNPNAFSYMSEPGSTFKTASIMVALEDGVVQPTDSFYVGTGLADYKGRTIRDHYWRKGVDRGFLTVQEGMEISSNIVVAKTILKGYEKDPEQYVKRLYELGITKPIDWDIPLKGREGKAYIRSPRTTGHYWSKTTLPWMSFGYETQIAPIRILMFYNGIANGGKMVKPYLVTSYSKSGKYYPIADSVEVLNPALCSEQTLKQIHNMLLGVVANGTGKDIASPYFPIAGKTGTALIADQGQYNSGYYVSFCGYFPADKPRYTCFVGIRRPKGVPSGGKMPGAVFKQIAEEIYTKQTTFPLDSLPSTHKERLPIVKNGNYNSLFTVMNSLHLPMQKSEETSSWVRTSTDSLAVRIIPLQLTDGKVPDVRGMGARDALFVLEQQGLKVRIQGKGKVVTQSVAAGTKIVKDATITLHLE